MNYEARMSNDEGSPNDETRKEAKRLPFRHLSFIIDSAFGFRHFPRLALRRQQRNIAIQPRLRKRVSRFLVLHA